MKDMEESGVIEPSHSEWASSIVVAKKDGSLRLCVDFRKLNAANPLYAYPMPRTDESLDKLGSAEYNIITTLDLAGKCPWLKSLHLIVSTSFVSCHSGSTEHRPHFRG